LVFYVSLLKEALARVVVSNKEIELDKDPNVYNVKKILNSYVSKYRKIEYLIKWLD